MTSLLESLVVGLNDENSLERVQKMLQKGAGTATNMAKSTVEQISSNIKWYKNYEKKICEHLKRM
jgi:hypothetical protein